MYTKSGAAVRNPEMGIGRPNNHPCRRIDARAHTRRSPPRKQSRAGKPARGGTSSSHNGHGRAAGRALYWRGVDRTNAHAMPRDGRPVSRGVGGARRWSFFGARIRQAVLFVPSWSLSLQRLLGLRMRWTPSRPRPHAS